MEPGIEMIINTLLYCLYLVLFIGTLILGFVQPVAAAKFVFMMTGPIMFVVAIGLIVHLFPTILTTILKITVNCITLIIAHAMTLVGAISTFIAGLGEAAILALQTWIGVKIAILAQGVESLVTLGLGILGLGAETSHWLVSGIVNVFSFGGTTLAIGVHFLGSIAVALGYGFGMIVVVLLNLVVVATSVIAQFAGVGPKIGMIAGGVAALLALPYIIQILFAIVAQITYLILRLILRLTLPLWRSSWFFGWITKMLVACFALAFYLERSIKNRPTITLSWTGDEWLPS